MLIVSMTIFRLSALSITLLALTSSAHAQLTSGFEQVAEPVVKNAEVVRQKSHEVMEVQFKQMRMIWVERPGPDGTPVKQAVWYLAWRATNRPLNSRDVDEAKPVNDADPLPGPTYFIPQLTLVTYDDPKTEIPSQILPDQIIPAAYPQIRKIETREGNPASYEDLVTLIREFPAPVDKEAEKQNWIYGATTWTGASPDTDFFKVIFQGFSNGYEVRGEGDGTKVWRKVLVQRFTSLGDRFDPDQREFKFSGEPEWTYQPDSSKAVMVSRSVDTEN